MAQVPLSVLNPEYTFPYGDLIMALKKVATNLPEDLLSEAVKATGLNQTQTIIEALKELVARERRQMGLRKSEAAKLDHTLHGLIHLLHDERIFSIADQILNSLRPKGLTFGFMLCREAKDSSHWI